MKPVFLTISTFFVLVLSFNPAAALPQEACNSLYALEIIHTKAKRTKSVDNFKSASAVLSAFQKSLSDTSSNAQLTDLNSVSQQAIQLGNDLNRTKKVLGADQSRLEVAAYWGLNSFFTSKELKSMKRECASLYPPSNLIMALAPLRFLINPTKLQFILIATAVLATITALGALSWHVINKQARKQRQKKRIICNIPAFFHGQNHSTPILIVDISQTGIKAMAPMQSGSAGWIKLQFSGFQVEAREKWRNKHFAGFKFRTPLNAEQFRIVLSTSQKTLAKNGILTNLPPLLQDNLP
jgi:hypothetical protein